MMGSGWDLADMRILYPFYQQRATATMRRVRMMITNGEYTITRISTSSPTVRGLRFFILDPGRGKR